MSRIERFSKFCKKNAVLLAGIPLIVGVHWGWYTLQQNPALVKPEEKKSLPIFIIFGKLYNYIREEITPSPKKPIEEKSN